MKTTHKRDPRVMSVISALLMLAAMLVSVAGPARANHGSRTLELTPETASYPIGTAVTVTAILSSAADSTSGTINIDVEAMSDGDGNTPGSPDYTCDIPSGSTSCTFTYTQSTSGSMSFRGWIDHDQVQSTNNSDTREGRFAHPDDCDQANDDPNACDPTANPFNPPTLEPGSGCGVPIEPDCTDVIRLTFTNPEAVAATLDCDDTGDEDTERETKGEGDSETYRCVVEDQFGDGKNDEVVNAEVENSVNDPDTTDGASYDPVDYRCDATSPDEQSPPFLQDDGVCYIEIEQVEGELGTAEICFWVGAAANGASLCGGETTDENASGGADDGNDLADQTELTWEDVSTFLLDCNPETDSEPTGAQHEVTCTATSPTSGSGVSGVEVSVEVTGTGDSDSSDSPAVPDTSCTTQPGGSCTFTDTSSSTGKTTYRAWIDDGDNEPTPGSGLDEDPDTSEGRDETATAGSKAEPDNTDVVENTWVNAPETLTISPKSDSANVGVCNPFTITAKDADGKGAASAKIDVEQVHQKATNSASDDEPTVSFCTPSSGPNPSAVDTSRGDRTQSDDPNEEDQESPDNRGTAGGRTVEETNDQGQVTIGIKVAAGQGSDGSGTTRVTAFFDLDNNADPDTDEPRDTAVKTWTGEPTSCPGHKNDSRKQIVGTSGPDVLKGGGRNEVICGLGGGDTIKGAGGKDRILGGRGKDSIFGGSGPDKINGNGGHDSIRGNSGSDRIRGDRGNDRLNGGRHRDACYGGPGRDSRKNCEN